MLLQFRMKTCHFHQKAQMHQANANPILNHDEDISRKRAMCKAKKTRAREYLSLCFL